jgi:transposase
MLRRIIGISQLIVDSFRLEGRELVVSIRPSWRRPRCGVCGRKGAQHERSPSRRWRHLAFGRVVVWLEYAPRRVACRRCGVKVERVPWAAHGVGFSYSLEEMVAYLAQVTDKTQVSRLTGIAWATVGAICERVVERRLDPGRLEGLRRIGIDEFSYRKRHRYLTIVVDHDSGRVVWAGEGRSAEALGRFFTELGPERCSEIEVVSIDMAGGYKKAVSEACPNAKIIYDRFHVQRLAADAVDEVRREALRALRGTPEGKELFGARHALRKRRWNLSPNDRDKLSTIQRTNAGLYRARLLYETLADILDRRQFNVVDRRLRDWLAWASRSRLKPMVKAARTIREHYDGILAYIRGRITNAVVEGKNTRLRMIARRAYGYHSASALIAMAFLCCGGIELNPPLPPPTHM